MWSSAVMLSQATWQRDQSDPRANFQHTLPMPWPGFFSPPRDRNHPMSSLTEICSVLVAFPLCVSITSLRIPQQGNCFVHGQLATQPLFGLHVLAVVRTLTGHRSNCLSVDFHPFAEYLASGSLDTNLKIWDVRNRSCIHTYKAHTRGVTHVRFSPDGRWVTSGSEDGTVKVGRSIVSLASSHPILLLFPMRRYGSSPYPGGSLLATRVSHRCHHGSVLRALCILPT